MRNGFKIVDIDTHVNPSYETLVKYLDPGGRSRVDELQPFVRTRGYRGETATRVLTVAPYPFDRFPGKAPAEAKVVAGGITSSCRALTTSTSAGPSWRNASLNAPSRSPGFSTRTPFIPIASAIAAKFGFFRSQ